MKFKSEEQFNLIVRQLQKLYDHRNKTTPREVRRKQAEYKLLKSLLNKMIPLGAPKEMYLKDINFNRQELRALQSLCLNGRKLLNELLIPGYEERMKKEEKEDLKERYKEYINKAAATDSMYAELLTDIEAGL